jgi:hypothetical protein
MSNNTLKLYIPRLLNGITTKVVKNTFNRLQLGDVYYIDMHRKINENRNVYYFAFIEINLYNTNAADNLANLINNNKVVKLIYDEEAALYWEVKNHIPKDVRNVKSSALVTPVTHEKLVSIVKSQQLPIYVSDENAGPENDDQIDYDMEDVFDYDTYIKDNVYNMWDNKYNFRPLI